MYAESQFAKHSFPFISDQTSDRYGYNYTLQQYDEAINSYHEFIRIEDVDISSKSLAALLFDGAIIARFAGRSEFGPRALGGRSLLASPLSLSSKQKLNKIKERQDWRPVAPIVTKEDFDRFFVGPKDSHYMNYVHHIQSSYIETLEALQHADFTTRVQTLKKEWDLYLWTLLKDFEKLSGFPVLVNTSFNGKGEPICERPEEAIRMFLRSPDIDYLLLDRKLISRTGNFVQDCKALVELEPSSSLSTIFANGGLSFFVSNGTSKESITADEYAFLLSIRTPRKLSELPGVGDGLEDLISSERIRRFIGSGRIKCLR